MLKPIEHVINIDLANKINMNNSINIKKNDTNSHKFIINIFNNSVAYDLTGTTSKIYFKKTDGTKVYLDCVLDNAVNGNISRLLTTQSLSCSGNVASEITIYGTAGEILTSVTFNFNVIDIVRDDNAIQSTSEFTALTTALAAVTGFTNVKSEVENARGGEVNLSTKIGKLDTQLADNMTQLNLKAPQSALDTTNNILASKAYQSDLEVEKNRINNLITFPPSIDNVETADIRVGVDGIIDVNAGDSVRRQINIVSKDIKPSAEYNILLTKDVPHNLLCKYKFIPNQYVDDIGVARSTDTFDVTPYIIIKDATEIRFGAVGLTSFYDINKNFISYIQPGYSTQIKPILAYYMRCSIVKENVNIAMANLGNIELAYDDGIVSTKQYLKEYKEGYIDFTVPVNQNKPIPTSTVNGFTDTENIVNVNCVMKLPGNYSVYGKPTKLVMLCHGAGKGVNTTDSTDTWIKEVGYNNIVNSLLSNGYAIFDCNGIANDLYHCNFWGEQRGVEAYRKAYQYIVNNYNVEKDFSIYGFSMGGLTALQIGSSMFPNIKCIALGSPVTNIKAIWDNTESAPLLAELYGMNNAITYEPLKVIGCDPTMSIMTINDINYFNKPLPPLKVWYGSTEIQPSPVDAQNIVNAIKNSNGVAHFRTVDGAGHEICFGANEYVNAEIVMWLNRFD